MSGQSSVAQVLGRSSTFWWPGASPLLPEEVTTTISLSNSSYIRGFIWGQGAALSPSPAKVCPLAKSTTDLPFRLSALARTSSRVCSKAHRLSATDPLALTAIRWALLATPKLGPTALEAMHVPWPLWLSSLSFWSALGP